MRGEETRERDRLYLVIVIVWWVTREGEGGVLVTFVTALAFVINEE